MDFVKNTTEKIEGRKFPTRERRLPSCRKRCEDYKFPTFASVKKAQKTEFSTYLTVEIVENFLSKKRQKCRFSVDKPRVMPELSTFFTPILFTSCVFSQNYTFPIFAPKGFINRPLMKFFHHFEQSVTFVEKGFVNITKFIAYFLFLVCSRWICALGFCLSTPFLPPLALCARHLYRRLCLSSPPCPL